MQQTQGPRALLNGPAHYVQVSCTLAAITAACLSALSLACFVQIAELGHGTFGIVIKAWDMRTQPPTEVAIKMLPRGDFVGVITVSTLHTPAELVLLWGYLLCGTHCTAACKCTPDTVSSLCKHVFLGVCKSRYDVERA